MPIYGNEQGLIPAFGVYLANTPADYYNLVNIRFLKEMTAIGKFSAAKELLLNAGETCAMNTYEFDDCKKIIQLDWSAILSGEDIVEKILVSLRDVTELRRLEYERVASPIGQAWSQPWNTSSRINASGRNAQRQLALAAEQVTSLCGGKGDEILWISGATEANNIAIRGSTSDEIRKAATILLRAVADLRALTRACG